MKKNILYAQGVSLITLFVTTIKTGYSKLNLVAIIILTISFALNLLDKEEV